ncbi:MAG: deoxyribose-phosphate aldolase [Thermodesulfovibrionales bacterium]|nr:deoxyribose-phosphate aldolase [Thermodesulfovibrionales bacterium]
MIPLNSYIDHSLLKPEATIQDIERICKEAGHYNFYAVCINPCYVSLAKEFLKESNVKVCTVIGFPLGASTKEAKLYEAMDAVLSGADELDIVMNIGLAMSGEWNRLLRELRDIIIATEGIIRKIIIETGLLSEDQIRKATEIVLKTGAEFIKTSTGFTSRGVILDDLRIIRQIAGDSLKIKASGGIRTLKQALELINAGAARLGTSAGVEIMKEFKGSEKYPRHDEKISQLDSKESNP